PERRAASSRAKPPRGASRSDGGKDLACRRRWGSRSSPAHNSARFSKSHASRGDHTMTRSTRALLRLSGWAALAATAALVGCSKKEETIVATAPAASAAASAPAPAAPLKIAFAYVGP